MLFIDGVIPMKKERIELVDANNEVKGVTFVDEVETYCMNGCYKVRDRDGVIRLVTPVRTHGRNPVWKCVSLRN